MIGFCSVRALVRVTDVYCCTAVRRSGITNTRVGWGVCVCVCVCCLGVTH